jgi:hypothetical protein
MSISHTRPTATAAWMPGRAAEEQSRQHVAALVRNRHDRSDDRACECDQHQNGEPDPVGDWLTDHSDWLPIRHVAFPHHVE